MYESLWLLLTSFFLVKICLGVIQVLYSLKFIITQNSSIFRRKKGTLAIEPTHSKIFVVVPLFREQKIVKELFQRFVKLVSSFEEASLVFVTTEREVIENNNSESGTTIEALKNLIELSSAEIQSKIIHLHYPKYNKVVAEQLNYVLEFINSHRKENEIAYALIYNADSVIERESFSAMLKKTQDKAEVVQQSSLFLWNTPDLLKERKFLLACFALYQSSWTLQHELSRYLFSKKQLPLLPKWVETNSLVHCVTHGLLINLDTVSKADGFPVTRFGGEDLALGFVLKVLGYHVEPLPLLENTEIPKNFRILFKQLAGWFLGTLGYFVFWKFVPKEARRKNFIPLCVVTMLGIYDSAKWLFKGIFILFYFSLGYIIGYLWLSVVLYLVYFYIALVGVIWLWYKLPDSNFPKPSKKALFISCLFYWLVPIIRSLPAFLGLYWGMRNALGYSFLKPKTER